MNEVCGVGLILDIDKIMYQLSRWRPIFHSEADFQFSLAWMIKEQYPNCDIRLEFVPEFNPNLHLDILVILDGKWIPIELKYTTRKYIKTINDEVYMLKEQGAKDQGCYNYLKDIMRIEEFVNVNIRMYNFDDVQCTVIPSVAYGFVTGMNLQLC